MRNVGNRGCGSPVVLVCLSVLVMGEAGGAIIPSFSWDESIRKATHIVVASEGERIDGTLQVVECYKGDLRSGEVIEIPELAQFASDESRTIHGWGEGPELGVVSGQRMILFLVKSLDWADSDTEKVKTKWLPSGYTSDYFPLGTSRWVRDDFGMMRISVAWLENGKTYAYEQTINPGPLLLTDIGIGDAEATRRRVEEWLEVEKGFHTINSIADPAERVKQAIARARQDPKYMADAVEIVAGAGAAAVPCLRLLLNEPSFALFHWVIIRDLADVEGDAAGTELTELLKRELAFWRETAPNLKKGWWNNTDAGPERRAMLQNRYSAALEALRVLEELHCLVCKETVSEFRDFWRSLPQLEDKDGLDQMSKTCDHVLNSSGGLPRERVKHAWGFELAAIEPDPVKRAEALVPFVEVGGYRASQRAFKRLSECGVAALPHLRSILDDEKLLGWHTLVVASIARAGGTRAGAEITHVIASELAYIKKNDLVKSAKRWNDLSPDARHHFGKLEEAVCSLDRIGYPDAVNEVAAVSAYLDTLSSAGIVDFQHLMTACTSYRSKYAS